MDHIVLKRLRQHAACALLMAFVMSWSSVASAVQKPIHSIMMQQAAAQESSSAVHHAMQNAQANTDSNCHDMPAMLDAKQIAEQNTLPHCDMSMANAMPSQCSDCALWHCQISVFSLDVYQPQQLDAFKSDVTVETIQSRYTEQYLKGYWQEILRTPKA